MKVVFADATYLKDSVGVISELVNEARFKFTRDGMELVAMDPANVAMVMFKLVASVFSEYDLKKDEEIGINLANFKQILRRAKPSDILSLEVLEDKKLQIQLKAGTTRTFSLPLIDLDDREQRIPSLQFPVHVELPSAVLEDAIADADIVAESVSFIAEPNKFWVQAEGDLNKAHTEVWSNDETQIKCESTARLKAKYSVEYLKKMMLGGKLADRVSVSFNQDYPLKLEFKIVDRLMLSFILAPRVEND